MSTQPSASRSGLWPAAPASLRASTLATALAGVLTVPAYITLEHVRLSRIELVDVWMGAVLAAGLASLRLVHTRYRLPLRRCDAQLEVLRDHSHDPILVVADGGVIVDANCSTCC